MNETINGQNNQESVNMGSVRPQNKSPDAKTKDIKTEPKPIDISTLPASDSWKVKFHLFQKAGGATLPKLKDLSGKERMEISFNVLAFLFGPIYYVFKGMWKKGLTLFACCVTVIFFITFLLELAGMGHLSKALRYGVAAIFAVRANIDYYKKMVLNQNGWW